jgi:hypothetical protein
MSIYDSVWNKIKTAGSAQVTVSKVHARTVEDGVKRIKSAENVACKMAGLQGWGKLSITRENLSATHCKLTFSIPPELTAKEL